MDCDNFIEKGEEVFSWLLNNRFNLDYVEADKCSTPGMMASSSDNNYEFNKSSLSRADAVLKNLKVLAGSYKDNV